MNMYYTVNVLHVHTVNSVSNKGVYIACAQYALLTLLITQCHSCSVTHQCHSLWHQCCRKEEVYVNASPDLMHMLDSATWCGWVYWAAVTFSHVHPSNSYIPPDSAFTRCDAQVWQVLYCKSTVRTPLVIYIEGRNLIGDKNTVLRNESAPGIRSRLVTLSLSYSIVVR